MQIELVSGMRPRRFRSLYRRKPARLLPSGPKVAADAKRGNEAAAQEHNGKPVRSTKRGRAAGMDNVLWYSISALGAIVAGAIGLIVYLLVSKRAGEKTDGADDEASETNDADLFGLLELEDGTRHMLDSDAYLIGRHSSNDLSIADPSVSRQHAEIHRRPDGIFRITDLDSMNGVFVNDKQLRQSVLRNGDKLELGDACMRFRLLTESELASDETMALDMSAMKSNGSAADSGDGDGGGRLN